MKNKKEHYIRLSVVEELGVTRLIISTTTYIEDLIPLLHLFIETKKFLHPILETSYDGRFNKQVELVSTLTVRWASDLKALVKELKTFINDLEPDLKVYSNQIFD